MSSVGGNEIKLPIMFWQYKLCDFAPPTDELVLALVVMDTVTTTPQDTHNLSREMSSMCTTSFQFLTPFEADLLFKEYQSLIKIIKCWHFNFESGNQQTAGLSKGVQFAPVVLRRRQHSQCLSDTEKHNFWIVLYSKKKCTLAVCFLSFTEWSPVAQLVALH